MPIAVVRVPSARPRLLGACVWLVSSLLICVTAVPHDETEATRVDARAAELEELRRQARPCPSMPTELTPEQLADLERALANREAQLREAEARMARPRSP